MACFFENTRTEPFFGNGVDFFWTFNFSTKQIQQSKYLWVVNLHSPLLTVLLHLRLSSAIHSPHQHVGGAQSSSSPKNQLVSSTGSHIIGSVLSQTGRLMQSLQCPAKGNGTGASMPNLSGASTVGHCIPSPGHQRVLHLLLVLHQHCIKFSLQAKRNTAQDVENAVL